MRWNKSKYFIEFSQCLRKWTRVRWAIIVIEAFLNIKLDESFPFSDPLLRTPILKWLFVYVNALSFIGLYSLDTLFFSFISAEESRSILRQLLYIFYVSFLFFLEILFLSHDSQTFSWFFLTCWKCICASLSLNTLLGSFSLTALPSESDQLVFLYSLYLISVLCLACSWCSSSSFLLCSFSMYIHISLKVTIKFLLRFCVGKISKCQFDRDIAFSQKKRISPTR